MVKNKEFYIFLKKQLKINPRKLELFELAFLHKSASLILPDGSTVNNERLEYLGDAIIKRARRFLNANKVKNCKQNAS